MRYPHLFLSPLPALLLLLATSVNCQQTVPIPPYNPGEPGPTHPKDGPKRPEPAPWNPDGIIVEPPMGPEMAALFKGLDTEWRNMSCFYQHEWITENTWWNIYVRDWSNTKQVSGDRNNVFCGGTLKSEIQGGTLNWECHSVESHAGEWGIWASFRLKRPNPNKQLTIDAVQGAITRASIREADHPALHMQCCHVQNWECLVDAPGKDPKGEGRPMRIDDLYGRLAGHWYFNQYVT